MTLTEAKTLAINTLVAADFENDVVVWDTKKGSDSPRFILVANIFSSEVNFSDDDNQDEDHYFYIYAYVEKQYLDELDGMMETIKTALKGAGFVLSPGGHNQATEDDLQSTYEGRFSEFHTWEN